MAAEGAAKTARAAADLLKDEASLEAAIRDRFRPQPTLNPEPTLNPQPRMEAFFEPAIRDWFANPKPKTRTRNPEPETPLNPILKPGSGWRTRE